MVRLFSFLLVATLAQAELNYNVTNRNFTISKDKTTYNYDRLRLQLDYSEDEFFSTIIADGVNYYSKEYVNSAEFRYLKLLKSDTPFDTQTDFYNYGEGESYAKLYRAYGGYEDDDNVITFGLQNITMGVGRIWTPTNIFNPKNSFSLEPDEVFGVLALNYTRNLNDTSRVSMIVSQKRDKSLKYAIQYKAFLEFLDFGVNAIYSNKTQMLAYELEGNLFDSGVEVRNESAYIKSKLFEDEIEFMQTVFGADYGFENGVNVVFESYYSSKKFSQMEMFTNYDSEIISNLVGSNFYVATSFSYTLNLFLTTSLSYIESFNEVNSRFFAPNLQYTLDDFNTLSIGALLYDAKDGSEFQTLKNSYYFNYTLSF